MTFVDVLVIILFFLAAFTFVMFFIGPKMLLQPKRSNSATYRKHHLIAHPSEIQLPFEDLVVTTNDNLKLVGWIIKTSLQAKGTILYLHGIGDNKGLGLGHAKLFYENGFNIVLFDFRAHGESDGTYCTYGFYEKYDMQNIIDFLYAQKDFTVGNIGLFGLSMGAAIALQTASIDKRIAAVVAENSFATLRTIFDDYQRRMIKLPFHYVRNLVIVRSEQLASFKASYVSPLDAVKNISCPILFICGKQDDKIHYRYSTILFDATPTPKELFPVELANHANVREIAGTMYDEKLISFYEKHLQ